MNDGAGNLSDCVGYVSTADICASSHDQQADPAAVALHAQSFMYKYNVIVNGIFDLPHFGHQQIAAKARQAAVQRSGFAEHQVKVIFGVCGTTEQELADYKRLVATTPTLS